MKVGRPFKKGNPGGPGRPKGSKSSLNQLSRALEAQGIKRGTTFWRHVAENAYTNDRILACVIKKYLPDKQSLRLNSAIQQQILEQVVGIVLDTIPDSATRLLVARRLRQISQQNIAETSKQ